MTQVVYNVGKKSDINWATADIRVLLLGGTSMPAGCLDPDLATVAAVLAVSGAAECNATNYARKTTTRTDTADNTNDRANQALSAAVTWTALGGATNDTVRGYLFYLYNASDSSAIPIMAESLAAGIPTNGTNLVMAAQDYIRVS